MSTPKPFKIDVAPSELSWITDRVSTARLIPDITHPPNEEWQDGTPTSVMQDIVEYWKTQYDWRAVEKKINETFKMFIVDIEEAGEVISLHFVHHRSTREDAVPLLFAHGWPGSFLEVENLLGLTEPEDPKEQAFHIIAPSIPGFTFSSSPTKPGFGIAHIANTYHKLMLLLGYTTYTSQGGDWGSFIIRSIAQQYPKHCIAVHLNFIIALPPSPLRNPLTLAYLVLRWFTQDQKERLGRMQWWMKKESGYSKIQGTKPQTIGYAFMDSPIGLLAWIREKIHNLAEPDFVWDNERVITWTMVYLLSGSASHARIYKEGIAREDSAEKVLKGVLGREVCVGVSCFPKDVGYVPRWWAEVSIGRNIISWKEHEKGGHFASVEVPEVLVGDLREWIGEVKKGTGTGSGGRWEALVEAGGNGHY